ncbi:hypothetical protein M6D93_06795 [Jatrophihabitans telluris]|uniref:Uncharacterized protein n=1 Tax=Jatrophihabitans telluris TaxID=2038343 RepID=A0ABY4R197_9ACTN|nr:DUF6758 family protein [Jatrophihabitans telluris]UQX89703.1 hypothetical protein M6D93_06795 [Jatrophihabitans telluris]
MLPLKRLHHLDEATLSHVRTRSEVPVWLPDPVPQGWGLSGLATVGDERSRVRATVTSFRGPAPLGGDGEWLIVAEEPGIGLGASYAASGEPELPTRDGAVPAAKLHAEGRPTSLWPVRTTVTDRSSYVGEAAGVWLWLISFPADAGYAVLEDLTLSDARTAALELAAEHPSERIRPNPV